MKAIEKRPGCVKAALGIVGDKWTCLILQEITKGSCRFSSLERNLDGISPRTLSQRLTSLEEAHIVTKQNFAEVPPRVEYALTPKGRDLLPILRQMAEWGYKYS